MSRTSQNLIAVVILLIAAALLTAIFWPALTAPSPAPVKSGYIEIMHGQVANGRELTDNYYNYQWQLSSNQSAILRSQALLGKALLSSIALMVRLETRSWLTRYDPPHYDPQPLPLTNSAP